MKAILVIADGMADRPVRELDWRTPLETARKPFLDQIAKTGVSGILDPISPGIPPGSDTATFALLGYDALRVYSGRGALEALGSGTEILPCDVAFRCNFATVDDDLVVVDRRAGRISNEDATELTKSISRIQIERALGFDFIFENTIQHRGVLCIRGSKLSALVSDSDPGRVGEKVLAVRSLDNKHESKRTAEIVNKLLVEFHKVLKDAPVNKKRIKRGLLPANMIMCRGAGTIPKIRSLSQIYQIKAACVGATPLVKGVCKVAGMDLIEVKGATGTPQTDYVAKVEAVIRALESYDFVLLHIKATDIASHDRNPKLKVEIIEKIDSALGYLMSKIDPDKSYLAVTADHTTSLATGNHEGDPVPIVITGPFVRRDGVEKFDERSCAEGGLNRIRGSDLMPILMNLLGRTTMFGA